MTSEREEFEAWARSRCELYRHPTCEEYSSNITEFAWATWQAARSAQHSTAEPVAWLRIERDDATGPATLDPLCLLGTRRPAGYRATYQPLFAAPQQAPLPESLHTFLDAAAGDGLVVGGVDAADLYVALFPERYAAAIADLDAGTEERGIGTKEAGHG